MKETLKKMVWFLLIIGLLYSIVATYIRVFEKGDYVIRYDIPCDPFQSVCFSEKICDESSDECEIIYSSSITRSKAKLEQLCGTDISTCTLAETCTEGEVDCSITFCNAETEDCATAEVKNE